MFNHKPVAMKALPVVLIVLGLGAALAVAAQAMMPFEVDGARRDAFEDGPTPTPTADYWRPGLSMSWDLQLLARVDANVDVALYDIDLFDNGAEDVAGLRSKGRNVVCYFSAGSWENWRPDANRYPRELLGRSNGWPGERWLDIRRLDLLGPRIDERLDLCKAKGFQGVDADNVDGHTNRTGFPLTPEDQLRFNIYVANAAHARGLSVGLKNDMAQINDLVPYFDWSINEQCFEHRECDLLLPFIQAGKPVFNVEYELDTQDFCPQANALNFNSIKKRLQLDTYREPCR
jgi:hypothetical protein